MFVCHTGKGERWFYIVSKQNGTYTASSLPSQFMMPWSLLTRMASFSQVRVCPSLNPSLYNSPFVLIVPVGCLRIAIADIVANSETTCPPELASASLSIPFESIASFAHHAIKTSPAPDAVVNTIDRIREKHRLQQARKRKAVEDIAPDGRVHVAEGPRFVKGNGKRIKTENPTENPTVSNVEVGGFKDDEVLEEDALEKASVSSNSNRTLIGEDAAPMLASGTADTSASTLQNPANSYRPPQHPRSGARKRTRSSPRQNQRPFSQRSESATTTTSDSRLSRNGSPASQPQRQVSTRMRKKPKSG